MNLKVSSNSSREETVDFALDLQRAPEPIRQLVAELSKRKTQDRPDYYYQERRRILKQQLAEWIHRKQAA